MLSVDPQGVIKLCKTPLEEDQQNQINFSSAEAQLTYFASTVQKTLENYTYVKEDGIICVEVPYDEAITYNYLYYRNTGFSNKYWFCFITKVEYVNENTSNLYIKTDVWQTFHLSLNYTQCFVEREHVADDTRGLHTIPEGLECGEPIVNGDVTDFTTFAYGDDYVYVIGVTALPNNTTVSSAYTPSAKFNGIDGGIYLIGTKMGSSTTVKHIINAYDQAGNGSAVQYVYIAPKSIFGTGVHDGSNPDDGWKWHSVNWTVTTTGGGTITVNNVLYFMTSSLATIPHEGRATLMAQKTFTSLGNLRGYVPKNNKMLCYPYNYLNITNNAGSIVTYRWEDFTNNTATFDELGVVTPGCSIRLEPRNYKGITGATETALDYGLASNKYPICSFQSDVYTNWLTQNSLNLQWVGEQVGIDLPNVSLGTTEKSIISAIQGMSVDVQSYTIPSTLFTTAENIYDSLQQKYKMSLTPPQAKGNNNVSDVTFSAHRADFTAVPMSIKYEYAKICDDYMSMYGYRVSTLKVPAINSRLNWNYVKTIGCNFTGNGVPQDAIAEIRGLFDRGITIWHNSSTFGDYTQSNTIVS